MKIFLGGEGVNDIGGWASDHPFRSDEPGIVQALLGKVRPSGWTITAACPWRKIRKLAYGRDLHGRERRNVLGLVNMAAEAGCEIVVFARDRDGDPRREKAIEAAIAEAKEILDQQRVAGGVAIETIDSWVLSVLGVRHAEEKSDPKAELARRGILSTADKVSAVAHGDLSTLLEDAVSLRSWLIRLEVALDHCE